MKMKEITCLDALAIKHNTDKSSLNHNYTKHYEKIFGPIRYQDLNIVEIGVWEGASLRMWRDYFPNAKIVGVDKHDRGIQVEGVDIVICSQDNPSLSDLLPGRLDIVIDDASHINALTITTFKNIFPHVKPGGLYIIEDLQTSYDPVNYDGHLDPDAFKPQITAMQFCKRLADELNRHNFPQEYRWGYNLESVQFYPNMCVITKGALNAR